jgi:hypothetical protein
VTIKNAEDPLFKGSSSALARTWTPPDSGRSEVGFISLDDANQKTLLGLTVKKDKPAEDAVEPIDGVAIELNQESGFRGLNVQTEACDDF